MRNNLPDTATPTNVQKQRALEVAYAACPFIGYRQVRALVQAPTVAALTDELAYYAGGRERATRILA